MGHGSKYRCVMEVLEAYLDGEPVLFPQYTEDGSDQYAVLLAVFEIIHGVEVFGQRPSEVRGMNVNDLPGSLYVPAVHFARAAVRDGWDEALDDFRDNNPAFIIREYRMPRSPVLDKSQVCPGSASEDDADDSEPCTCDPDANETCSSCGYVTAENTDDVVRLKKPLPSVLSAEQLAKSRYYGPVTPLPSFRFPWNRKQRKDHLDERNSASFALKRDTGLDIDVPEYGVFVYPTDCVENGYELLAIHIADKPARLYTPCTDICGSCGSPASFLVTQGDSSAPYCLACLRKNSYE